MCVQSTIRSLHERLSQLQSQCATSDVLSGSIVAANALSRAFAAVTSAQKSVNTADMTPGKITPADLKRIILSAENVLEGAEIEVKRELEKELAWQAVKGEAAEFVTTAKTRVEAAISALKLMGLVSEAGQAPPTTPTVTVTAGLLAAISMTISEAVEAVALVEDLSQRQRGLSIDPAAAVSTIVDVPALKQFMNAAEDRVSVLEATVTLETRKRQSESELKAKQEATRRVVCPCSCTVVVFITLSVLPVVDRRKNALEQESQRLRMKLTMDQRERSTVMTSLKSTTDALNDVTHKMEALGLTYSTKTCGKIRDAETAIATASETALHGTVEAAKSCVDVASQLVAELESITRSEMALIGTLR
jgi:hypothetical protein